MEEGEKIYWLGCPYEEPDCLINEATVIKTDIAASNGVIHVIDTVILPSS